jgi:hypothetical protein
MNCLDSIRKLNGSLFFFFLSVTLGICKEATIGSDYGFNLETGAVIEELNLPHTERTWHIRAPHGSYASNHFSVLAAGSFADGTSCNPDSLILTNSIDEMKQVQTRFMVVKLSQDIYYEVKWISDNPDNTVTFLYQLCSGERPSIVKLTSTSCTTTARGWLLSMVCPVTDAMITIHGQQFNESGKVFVGGHIVENFLFWNTSTISFVFPAKIGTNLRINVTTKYGWSTSLFPTLSYSPPTVTSISPSPGDAEGIQTAFTGTNFGTTSSTITIKVNNVACTDVTWVSNTEVQAITPAGSGVNHAVVINVGGQDSTSAPTFSYKFPNITNVIPALAGGTMIIQGEDFAVSNTFTIVAKDRNTNSEVVCDNPQRISYTEVRCNYVFPGLEGQCQERDLIVRIDGLESNLKQLCYTASNGGLVGPFATKSVTEGAVTSYKVRLLTPPFSSNVAVTVSSSTDQCKLSSTDLTFTTTNWNVDQPIDVSVNDDGKYYAKDITIFSCVLTHTVTSIDAMYATLAPVTSTLTAISTGCGLGEFLGAYNRKNNGAECACQQNYFLPPNSDCETCPVDRSVCASLGLTAPPVAPNWWRADPTSPDLQAYTFYSCPFPGTCTGGNSSMGRCIEGHDDKGVVCATCSAEYVLQGQRCVFCEGRKDAAVFSSELLALCMAGLMLFSLATFAFLTQPALTKKDVQLLKSELKPHELTTTVKRKEFLELFQKRTSLTASQLDQAFDLIDENKDGSVDLKEILSFTSVSAGVKVGELHDEGQQAVEQISEKVNKIASPQAVGVWHKHTGLLKSLEEWVESMKESIKKAKKEVENFLKQFRLKLDTSFGESEWLDILMKAIRKILMEPIERLEAYVQKVEGVLHQMKQAFLEHVHDMKALLARLKGLYLELNILFATFPSFHLDFDIVWPRIVFQLNSFDIDLTKLETLIKDLLTEFNTFFNTLKESFTAALNKLKGMLQSLLYIQWKIGGGLFDLGGWLMKLKIFIGFAQCFAYFPVTFDIPWPQNLLAFMKAMEFTAFDLYAVFGDVSCRMQTGFLQKYVYHMALFPAILSIIAGMYLIARFLRGITQYCRCTKYTSESLKTQVFTLLSLVSFALYTGISTRIFRLFKCRKIQAAWYLTADYTVTCQEGEWNGYAASGALFIILYVVGIPGVQLYLLYRNRHILHVREGMTHEEKQEQHVVEKEYGSIYANYTTECYYYDIIDLFRRLLLTGGLIMMGEESVAQVFLGIIICAFWMSLLIHKKPYKAGWDNIIAVILAAHLLLTLVSGMALKLYDATPGQDEYQKAGFGAVLITVSVLCVVLGLGSIVVSTPCLRETAMKCLKRGQRKERVHAEKVAVVVDGGIEMTHRKEI